MYAVVNLFDVSNDETRSEILVVCESAEGALSAVRQRAESAV